MALSAIPTIIVSGILTGGVYGLLAMGLSLQYGVARVLNISHGEFVMLGALLTYTLYTGFGINPLVAAAIVGPLLFAIGFLLQITLFRGLKARAPAPAAFEGNALLAAFGLLYVIQNIGMIRWGGVARSAYYLNYAVTFLGMSLRFNRIVAFTVAVVLGVAVYLFLNRSRMGRAIRATAEDPATAGLMGVNVNIVLALCFGLGALLAGIAGSLITMFYSISSTIGFSNTVIALIVVVLGGLGSVPGSFIAGIIIGIVTSLVTSLWQPILVVPVYYGILLALLLVRPAGLLGKK
ncbi:MAG TPA: branched-chain amino acid ABC transporter permease [Dehalococcoidia bacterium]